MFANAQLTNKKVSLSWRIIIKIIALIFCSLNKQNFQTSNCKVFLPYSPLTGGPKQWHILSKFSFFFSLLFNISLSGLLARGWAWGKVFSSWCFLWSFSCFLLWWGWCRALGSLLECFGVSTSSLRSFRCIEQFIYRPVHSYLLPL